MPKVIPDVPDNPIRLCQPVARGPLTSDTIASLAVYPSSARSSWSNLTPDQQSSVLDTMESVYGKDYAAAFKQFLEQPDKSTTQITNDASKFNPSQLSSDGYRCAADQYDGVKGFQVWVRPDGSEVFVLPKTGSNQQLPPDSAVKIAKDTVELIQGERDNLVDLANELQAHIGKDDYPQLFQQFTDAITNYTNLLTDAQERLIPDLAKQVSAGNSHLLDEQTQRLDDLRNDLAPKMAELLKGLPLPQQAKQDENNKEEETPPESKDTSTPGGSSQTTPDPGTGAPTDGPAPDDKPKEQPKERDQPEEQEPIENQNAPSDDLAPLDPGDESDSEGEGSPTPPPETESDTPLSDTGEFQPEPLPYIPAENDEDAIIPIATAVPSDLDPSNFVPLSAKDSSADSSSATPLSDSQGDADDDGIIPTTAIDEDPGFDRTDSAPEDEDPGFDVIPDDGQSDSPRFDPSQAPAGMDPMRSTRFVGKDGMPRQLNLPSRRDAVAMLQGRIGAGDDDDDSSGEDNDSTPPPVSNSFFGSDPFGMFGSHNGADEDSSSPSETSPDTTEPIASFQPNQFGSDDFGTSPPSFEPPTTDLIESAEPTESISPPPMEIEPPPVSPPPPPAPDPPMTTEHDEPDIPSFSPSEPPMDDFTPAAPMEAPGMAEEGGEEEMA